MAQPIPTKRPGLVLDIPADATTDDDPATIQQITRQFADLQRRLIVEENEQELLFLFRETKRLKSQLDALKEMGGSEPPAKPDKPLLKKSAGISKSQVSRKKLVRAEGMMSRSLYLPPPPKTQDQLSHGADTARNDDNFEEGEDVEADDGEYFVCAECGQEDYGCTDERDGNFYCWACWEQYSAVGTTQVEELNEAQAPVSIEDPTHPDYWENLKKESESTTQSEDLESGEGPPSLKEIGSRVSTADVFGQFAIQTDIPKPDVKETETGQSQQAGEIADVILKRIQDKRKSLRFIKKDSNATDVSEGPTGKDKQTKKARFRANKVAKKNKKKKMDPKQLASEEPKIPLGPRGLLVDKPVNPLPVPKPQVVVKRLPLSSMAKRKPQQLFPLQPDGSVLRSIYTYVEELVDFNSFKESRLTAVADWDMKNLPVRAKITPFLLDDFGGATDTNRLSSATMSNEEWKSLENPYNSPARDGAPPPIRSPDYDTDALPPPPPDLDSLPPPGPGLDSPPPPPPEMIATPSPKDRRKISVAQSI